jgi:tape measure domain-containing protein
MTTPTGGGNSLGTAYGKVRIDYESSGAAKATKDVEALQSSLVQTGSAAEKSAKQISSAVGSINNFAAQTAKVGQNIKNPVEGLSKSIQNEVEKAAKVLKSSVTIGELNIKPTSVRLDKSSLDKAIEDWKASAKKELSIDDVSLGINVTSASLSQSASAAKELAEAFREGLIDGIKQAVEEAGNRAGDGFSDSVDKQTNKARGSGSKLAGAFGGALKTGLGVAAAGVTAATAGVGFVLQQGFSRLQGIDQASAKLKALGLNVNQIAAVSKSALASVQDTAFGMDDAFSAAANAINAGIKPGKELDKYLMALSNTAALAGTSMTDLGDALSDAAIQGKLTGDVVQSLVARQVPVFQLIADEYDTTAIKAQQMVSNSEVSFDRFVDAMSKNTEAARIMGQTITGSWQNMMASIKRIGAALLSPIFGSATGDAGTFALAIQAVTNKLKEVEKWLGDHKNDVIDWWVGFGKAALAAAQVVTGVVSGIVWGLGRLAKVASGIVRLLGKTDTADSLSKFGDDADAASYKIQDFNKTLDKGYGKLDEFGQKAKDAKKPTAELGDAAGDGKEKMISLADALEKLGFKADAVTKAIEGTNKEFKDFIKQLSDKKAPQALIDALTKLHDQYNNGGRQVKAYADAIDQLGDSSVDASTKASDLIKALKGLNQLPNDDALANYNEQFDKMTDYMSSIIDLSDVMGNKLVAANGKIDTNSKNGQSLLKAINEIQQSAFELASSGTVDPGDVWDRTAQEMQDVLVRQAGISPDMAAKIMDTYILPKDQFMDQIKKKADPKGALEGLFKDNPAQLDSAINLLTTTDDLLKQLIPEGPLFT